jgi:hypothetical protein
MIERYWINAPSALQCDHRFHGARVLCDKQDKKYGANSVLVYFAEGNIASCLVTRSALSPGWPKHLIAPATAGDDQ